ncbi:MAG: hypothetical protein N2645_04345 [Clostridia bacterium]|nr:hypothetical protein [Clostridia bacterium]
MGFAVRAYEVFIDDEVTAKISAEFIQKVEEAISNNQNCPTVVFMFIGAKVIKEMKEGELRLIK